MKKLKWWSICLQSLTCAPRPQRPETDSLTHETRGPSKKKQEDWEVNTTDHENRKQQPIEQKKTVLSTYRCREVV
jgi:hypothetical protein